MTPPPVLALEQAPAVPRETPADPLAELVALVARVCREAEAAQARSRLVTPVRRDGCGTYLAFMLHRVKGERPCRDCSRAAQKPGRLERAEARLAVARWCAGTRRACGISQQTVAAALRVGQSSVSRWDLGQAHPSPAYLRVIQGLARHLEVGDD